MILHCFWYGKILSYSLDFILSKREMNAELSSSLLKKNIFQCCITRILYNPYQGLRQWESYVICNKEYLIEPQTKWHWFCTRHVELNSMHEYVVVSIKPTLTFVPQGPVNNESALVQIMARCPSTSPYLNQWWSSLPIQLCICLVHWGYCSLALNHREYSGNN